MRDFFRQNSKKKLKKISGQDDIYAAPNEEAAGMNCQ